MKRGTARHPKTDRLMRLLGINRATAIGTLELLWEFAKEFAIEGDVGRWSDAELAAAVDWPGDPRSLIAALVESGWLDSCRACRLVIHDVEDHADQPWQRLLQRRGLTFRRAVPLAMASQKLAMDSLARGMGMGSGSSSGSESETTDPAAVVAPVRRESQRSLTGIAARDPLEGFEAWWRSYPRHDGKQAAIKAWRKLRPDPALQELMAAALSWQVHREQWQDPEKIPHGSTWLNGKRWEDERPRVAMSAMSRELRESLPAFEAFLAKQRAKLAEQQARPQLEERKA